MSAKKQIGIIAPVNWEKPASTGNENFYLRIVEEIRAGNPDLEISILNYETLDQEGHIDSISLAALQPEIKKIQSFDLVHFLDFESPDSKGEPLCKKWDRILQKLDVFDNTGVNTINSTTALRHSVSKEYLLDIEKKGIAIMESTIVENSVSLTDLKSEFGRQPFVIKPVNGECSKFVHRLDHITEKEFTDLQSQSNKLLVQPFHEEVLDGEFSMLFFRDQLSHAIVKRPKDRQGMLRKYTLQPYQPGLEEIEFGRSVFSAFPAELDIFRVDFILRRNKPLLMEVESVDPFHYVIENNKQYVQRIGEFYRFAIN